MRHPFYEAIGTDGSNRKEVQIREGPLDGGAECLPVLGVYLHYPFLAPGPQGLAADLPTRYHEAFGLDPLLAKTKRHRTLLTAASYPEMSWQS